MKNSQKSEKNGGFSVLNQNNRKNCKKAIDKPGALWYNNNVREKNRFFLWRKKQCRHTWQKSKP